MEPLPAPEVIDLRIDFDGTLLWNMSAVDRATLQGYITAEAKKSPQPEVHIMVDKFANYQTVVQTLADLQRRGLQKIGFVNNDFNSHRWEMARWAPDCLQLGGHDQTSCS